MFLHDPWLREFVNTQSTPEEIEKKLTQAGIEVEEYFTGSHDPKVALNSYALALTPNRGDCLSVYGIAREIAAIEKLEIKKLEFKNPSQKLTAEIQKNLIIENPESCPKYLARCIRSIKLKDDIESKKALENIREKLRKSGIEFFHLEPIVQIMEYVMLELGQPLHAFDYDHLGKNIHVRLAQANEQLTLLNKQTVKLQSNTLLIADEHQSLAIAGVMGGQSSAVSATTQNILIESAHFSRRAIAGQARKYGLSTNAAYRFERGVDPNLPELALERATELILKIADCEVYEIQQVVHSEFLPKTENIFLSKQHLIRHLGMSIDDTEITDILHRLHFQFTQNKEGWEVTPPSFRFDMQLEEDLIEEIIRIKGYDQLPTHLPSMQFEQRPREQATQTLRQLQNILLSHGYQEAITYSFVSPEFQQSFLLSNQQPLDLLNPLSQEMAQMRVSLIPSLLQALNYNLARQQNRIRLFETGLVFEKNNQDIVQKPMIAGMAMGSLHPLQWASGKQSIDFYDIKSDVEALVAAEFKAEEHPSFQKGQTAAIYLHNALIGWCGALHPSILQSLGIQVPVYGFELMTDPLLHSHSQRFKEISRFPSVRRDLSFLIHKEITAKQIEETIYQTNQQCLKEVIIFDVYQGKSIEPDHKSIAIALVFQHLEQTLMDTEIQQMVTEIIQTLQKAYSIVIRA